MQDHIRSLAYDFGGLLVYLLTGFVFTWALLALSRLVQRKRPTTGKRSTYECGEVPVGSAWVQFNVRFYVIALIFLIFDVETAFIFPAAAVFKSWILSGRGLAALLEIVIFVAILLFGLAYVWARRDLEWVKAIRDDAAEAEGEVRKVAGA